MTRPRDMGFSSLRFDFVRGYKAEHLREYAESTVAPRGELSVAEFWDDGGGIDPNYTSAEMLASYCERAGPSVGCFDFPLKGALMNAFRDMDMSMLAVQGEDGKLRAPGLMGLRPGQSFTWLENHDTSAPQCHWPFPESPGKMLAGYAYILCHPGIPCVFWPHMFGVENLDGVATGKPIDVTLTEEMGRYDERGVWVPPEESDFSWEENWPGVEPGSVGSQAGVKGPCFSGLLGRDIKAIAKARKATGVRNDSPYTILRADKELYVAEIMGKAVFGSAREQGSGSEPQVVAKLRVAIGVGAAELDDPEPCAIPEGNMNCGVVSVGALHRVDVCLGLPGEAAAHTPQTFSL